MTDRALPSIWIVEDAPRQLRPYSRALRGYRLTCVGNGSAALQAMADQAPDVIILDQVLDAGEKGLDFLPRLKAVAAHVPIIVVSGTLDIAGKLSALQGRDGAHYVLEKPVDLDQLESTVQIAWEKCGLGETVRSL